MAVKTSRPKTGKGVPRKKRPVPPGGEEKAAKAAAAPTAGPGNTSGKPPEGAPESPSPKGGPTTTAQVSSIFAKLMELADAGMGLGMNVISLLNSLAHSQLSGRVSGEDAPADGGYAQAPGPAAPPPHEARPESAEAGRTYCVVNRTRLVPGGPVRVSFSINNDLAADPKRLRLSARDFAGATRGFSLGAGAVTVEPAEQVIAPMDFEKFVLQGTIPAQAPEDSYNGWILVEGDEELRIPVVLVVSGKT